VVDLPAAVTDTHPLIYHALGGRALGPRAAAFFERCERQQAVLYVPAAVIWECTLLARVELVYSRLCYSRERPRPTKGQPPYASSCV